MTHFQLGRTNLSAWYVAILISYFVFFSLKDLIIRFTEFLIQALKLANIQITDQNSLWLCLFSVCFLLTLGIKHFFVDNLKINIEKDGGGNIEKQVLAFLMLGLYLYVFNRIFNEPMPTFVPKELVNLFGGEVYSLNSSQYTATTWAVIQGILWHLGPLAMFWIGANVQK